MLEHVNSLPWKGASLDRNHLPARSDGNQAGCLPAVRGSQLLSCGLWYLPRSKQRQSEEDAQVLLRNDSSPRAVKVPGAHASAGR